MLYPGAFLGPTRRCHRPRRCCRRRARLAQPAVRVILPQSPAAERGGGRQGGMAAGSGLLGGLFRLLPETGGKFLAERYLAAGRRLACYAQSI